MEGIVIVIIAISIIVIISKTEEYEEKQYEKEKKEEEMRIINSDKIFNCSKTIEDIIELDEKKQLFKIKHLQNNNIYKYSDILGVEMYENNSHIVTTSDKGNALVGGLLFGKVGAIVGANTATRNSRKVIDSLIIKLTIDDKQNPVLNIDLMDYRLNFRKLPNKLEKAQIILSTFEKMKDSSLKKVEEYDELIKYKELLNQGIITEQEFEKKKKEILNI